MKKAIQLLAALCFAVCCAGAAACGNNSPLPDAPSQEQEENKDTSTGENKPETDGDADDGGKENNGIWTGIRNPEK